MGQISFTLLAKQALELTAKEAMTLGHNYIGCEHLLLGLLAAEDGLASQVLRRMGLELRTTRRAVIGALIGFVHAQTTSATTSAPPPSPDVGPTLEEILRRLDAIEERLAG
jgi:ATP-dependent Clp protease ATP-binding subunit ClpC